MVLFDIVNISQFKTLAKLTSVDISNLYRVFLEAYQDYPPIGTRRYLAALQIKLGEELAIKVIKGYESPYGVALLARLLGIDTGLTRFRVNHLRAAQTHLLSLGIELKTFDL
jgi:hypothetical protein